MNGQDLPPGAGWDDPESSDAEPFPDRAARHGAAAPNGAPSRHGAATGAGPGDEAIAEARALLAGAGGARRPQWLASRRRQVFAGVVVLGAIGWLAFQGLTNATQYFQTAGQAVAHRATLGTKPFRIEGTVEHDVRTVGTRIDFTIYGGGQAVDVVSTGSPPQLFRPGIPVVLDGHWLGGVFAADQIMVKHTASYTEAHPKRLRPQLPATGKG